MYSGRPEHVKFFIDDLTKYSILKDRMCFYEDKKPNYKEIIALIHLKCTEWLIALPSYNKVFRSIDLAREISSINERKNFKLDLGKKDIGKTNSFSIIEIDKLLISSGALESNYVKFVNDSISMDFSPVMKRTIALYFGEFSWENFYRSFNLISTEFYQEDKKLENTSLSQDSNELEEDKVEKINDSSLIHNKLDQILKTIDKDSDFNLEKEIEKRRIEINNTPNYVAEIFNRLIDTGSISADFSFEIREYFRAKYKWHNRAIISAGIALSTLKGWDEEKIQLLVDMALMKNEPYVSERAIIGIVFALILAYETKNFQRTIEILEPLHHLPENRNYLCQTIDFFIKAFVVNKSEFLKVEILDEFEFLDYQHFEPFHSDNTFHTLRDDLQFENYRQQDSFFILLEGSLSLSYSEKLRVYIALNRLKKDQNRDLIKIFNEEKKRFGELALANNEGVSKLRMDRSLEQFYCHLNNFDISILKEKFKVLDYSLFCSRIFSIFPDINLLRWFDFSLIENVLDNDTNLLKASFRILKDENRYKEALEIRYKILEKQPKEASSYFHVAYTLSRLKRKDEAIDWYGKAIAIDQKFSSAFYNISTIYLDYKKSYELAHIFVDKYLSLSPENVDGYRLKSRIFISQKMFLKAISILEKAIELDSEEDESWELLQLVLCQDVEKKESLEYFYAKLENSNFKLVNWFCIAILHEKSGEFELGSEFYLKLHEKIPNNSIINLKLGWLSFVNKNFKQARVFLDTAFKPYSRHFKKTPVAMNIGHCELIEGNRDKAIEYYKLNLKNWNYNQYFFRGFDEDYEYLDGVSIEDYEGVRAELQQFCMDNEKKETE